MRTTLRDRSGNTLGFVQEVSPYRHELHAANGKLLGYYNPHLDQTFTASGQMVGHGNLLAALFR